MRYQISSTIGQRRGGELKPRAPSEEECSLHRPKGYDWRRIIDPALNGGIFVCADVPHVRDSHVLGFGAEIEPTTLSTSMNASELASQEARGNGRWQ